MVIVLLVTTLCMAYVSASVVGATGGIRPARATADSMAALAAAQAGVVVLTKTVESCGKVATGCAAISGTGAVSIAPADGTASRASYRWAIVETPDQNTAGVLRMQVTGQVRTSTRTLVADFETIGAPLDYAMFTDIETLGPQSIASTYPARTVQLPDATVRAKADLLVNKSLTSVTWPGPPGPTGTDICRVPWFDTSGYGTGRAKLRTTRGLSEGIDYTEVSTAPGGSSAITRVAACEVPYDTGFLTSDAPDVARVYSRDAMYISNSVPGGAGPRFQGAAVTEWGTASSPAPTTPGKWYRSDASSVGGDPATGYETVSLAPSSLTLPAPVAGIESLPATCVFTGPTRILLSATATTTTATVTSPGTASPLPAKCGATSNGDSTLEGTGVKKATIPVSSAVGSATAFYVKDGSSVAAASAANNPVFNLQKFSSAPLAANQPNVFYSEMNVSDAQAKSYIIGAPRSQLLNQTLDPLFAQLNDSTQDVVNGPAYQTTGVTTTAPSTSIGDGLYEPLTMSVTVTRKQCTTVVSGSCTKYTTPTNAFTYSREINTFPLAKDVTPYQTGAGVAFVEGNITGNLTIVAQRDIVATQNTTYTNADSILGLVAGTASTPGYDVEIYHPVGCVTTTPATAPGGTCPNDITGLYRASTASLGTANPALQYTDLLATDLKNFQLAATILVPGGALSVQNATRGSPQYVLTVTGAVYEKYRGQIGLYYGPTSDKRSGYSVTLQYDATLRTRQPPSFSTTAASGGPLWHLIGYAEKQ